ncbi:MAG TPA: efflux RND transporter periplasmic adaptor subunit [Gemmatimonadaceae bacterium]|jgi:cobalt-zinc-cadmium efflux system membrane fusion protein|nr:efflux RND transporter periplasmic adaptor subunit [Gemmatimonadaceae bacterium]
MIYRSCLLATLVMVAACSSSKTSDETAAAAAAGSHTSGGYTVTPDQRAKLHLQTVGTSMFSPTIQTTGNVVFNGDKSTQVLAPVGGPVTRILVQLGASVTKGEPLATVSSPDFAAAVATYLKAQVTARNLRHIADVNQQLFQNDALAHRDLEQSQADAASAEADRDASLQAVRAIGVDEKVIDAVQAGRPTGPIEAVIRAPINGTVVERLIAPGQLLATGTTPCFTIADLSSMWVMADVFVNDVGLVASGNRAQVTTDASSQTITGKVDYVAALVDTASKATSVRVLVPNPGHVLKQDMYVRVAIQTTHQHQGMLVSSMAVLRDDENLPFVFVMQPDSSFNRRRITLGPIVGDSYEVTSGLSAGDQVVTEGALFLQFAESQ